ncbi:MAG: ATP-binding protein [Magnetovibrio sp.]|nr:ATP-binding protein [Magnetovibrio sp.]
MSHQAVKLEEIMGRVVSLEDSWDVADYLMACLTHVTNARPLFGVVDLTSELLTWTAGGAEFHDLLDHQSLDGEHKVQTFGQLFACFGIAKADYGAVIVDATGLGGGASMTVLKPMAGHEGAYYRLVMRKRYAPNDHQVQFSLMDITPFQEAAIRTQALAATLAADMDEMHGDQPGARALLHSVIADLERLFALQQDDDIAALTRDMSERVTKVSERMVQMLLAFEQRYDTSHWQPRALNPGLRPVISVHTAPVKNWHELHGEVLRTVDGVPAVIAEIADQMRHALHFVQCSAATMVISPTRGRIFALNGPAAEQEFSTIEDFVRAIGVEENSTRTAVEFFSNLETEPALGLFALNNENVEAWGRPGLYGGWQALLLQSGGQGVDVRGLFHGLKNLLLHLQVLYVVNTGADVDQVQNALALTATKIEGRLNDLDAIAQTGHRRLSRTRESVSQWLGAAKRVEGRVEVACDGVDHTMFTSAPLEMEDTLEELVRNAFQHGASRVKVGAYGKGNHLCMQVVDDGRGMSQDKLIQVQRVLKKRIFDPNLSTRDDGTGNGLLAAANAVSRFVDGKLTVDHGPDGRGVKITISMKLPA